MITCRSMCFRCEPMQVTGAIGQSLVLLMSLLVYRSGAGHSSPWSAPTLGIASLVRSWSVVVSGIRAAAPVFVALEAMT